MSRQPRLEIGILGPCAPFPKSFGNRKRVHDICVELKKFARLHYFHYPMEGDYRNGLPMDAERQNREFFDNYILVPPTRPLQTDPIGGVHNIDEWFDEAIGSALNWYTSLIRFDIFIVNYVYLSKAFEYLRQHPFKVLDTHDKFAGRHKLLAEAGIAPEYFYTNEKQEAVGLARADLVWAIKDEELDYFSSITKVPVETCPSPLHKIVEEKAEQKNESDLLRVGYLGARNSVNKNSLIPFLNELVEVDRYHAAPFELRIFGNITQDLKEFDKHSKIKLCGFIDQVDDFYEQVDLSINPVEHSSGQKIKSLEGVEYEIPQLLTKNAAEGVLDDNDLGVSANCHQLVTNLLNVSFDTGLLKNLSVVATSAKQKINSKSIKNIWDLERRFFQRNSYKIFIQDASYVSQLSEYLTSSPAVITRVFSLEHQTCELIKKVLSNARFPELVFLNDQRASLVASDENLDLDLNLLGKFNEAWVFEGELSFWQHRLPDCGLKKIEHHSTNSSSPNLGSSAKPPSDYLILVLDNEDLGLEHLLNSFTKKIQITGLIFDRKELVLDYFRKAIFSKVVPQKIIVVSDCFADLSDLLDVDITNESVNVEFKALDRSNALSKTQSLIQVLIDI